MTSWLASAIQTVRDKSVDALDFVRRDLSEFTTTVKTDTETYINKIKTQEVGDLGINRFVSKLSESMKTDNDDEKHFKASGSYDRVHGELTRLQNDESTYLSDPTPIEAYENWRQTTEFNVDTRKGEIAQLLIDAPHVRSFYAHLVPAQTTHSDFWSRYYFRLHQIEEEEARRTQLLKRAHEICSENNENTGKNSENDWDEPDEEWSREPTNIIQQSTPESVSVEHHEEQQQQQQQEPIPVNTTLEKSNTEQSESDTVSGDSWEREFDESDVVSSKLDEDPLTKSEETITSESFTTSTTTLPSASSSISKKKKDNESDDEWEGWA